MLHTQAVDKPVGSPLKQVLSLVPPHHMIQASFPPSLPIESNHAWETFAEGLGHEVGGGGQLG